MRCILKFIVIYVDFNENDSWILLKIPIKLNLNLKDFK